MSKLLNSVIWRAVRGSVSLWLANWWAVSQANPNLIWLTPVFLAIGKALRDKFPGKLTDLLPI